MLIKLAFKQLEVVEDREIINLFLLLLFLKIPFVIMERNFSQGLWKIDFIHPD